MASWAAASANCVKRSARRACLGLPSKKGSGSKSATLNPCSGAPRKQTVPERFGAGATVGDDADAGNSDAACHQSLFGNQVERLAGSFDAFELVLLRRSLPNSSSRAMTSSTRSRLSASRSSAKLASLCDFLVRDLEYLDGAFLEAGEQFITHGYLFSDCSGVLGTMVRRALAHGKPTVDGARRPR